MNYSKWASKEEIKSKTASVNLDTGVKKSGLPVMYDDKFLYIDNSEAHNLLIGSTGSGKTQAIVLPLLKLSMMAGESIVINDPKGEIYAKTAHKLEEEGYKNIVIDFEDSRRGNNWNPLTLSYKQYKAGNPDKAIELIEDLGYYLLADTQRQETDPFWTNSTINYFTGLVLYLFKKAKEEEINLSSVAKLANSLLSKEESEKFLHKVENDSVIFMKLAGTLQAPPETRGSIISVFNQKIERYLSKENLANMISTSDFDITTVSTEKTAIFIVSGISSFCRNLIPLFANQIMNAVSLYGNKEKRLNLLLDEFDSLIPIKDFAVKLGYCRSINIRVTVAIQSFAHLANMYSKEDVEILKMCFGNTIYLLSEDIYTLEEISKNCGTHMVDNKEEPLISVSELKTLGYFEAIILMPRMMPFRTKLLPDYEIDWGYETIEATIPTRKDKKIEVYEIEK